MTKEERIETAASLKACGKANCTQAVLKVFEDKLNIQDDFLMKMTSGFAAGMGCMESTCGALTGAVMLAGIFTDGMGSARYSKEIVKKFQESCGATICKDLKGLETKKVLCECPDCVRNAIKALYDVFGENITC